MRTTMMALHPRGRFTSVCPTGVPRYEAVLLLGRFLPVIIAASRFSR